MDIILNLNTSYVFHFKYVDESFSKIYSFMINNKNF